MTNLVEVDLLSTPQTVLQRASNLDRLHRTTELEWQCSTIQTRGSKLLCLCDKGLCETTVVVRRDLPPDTSRLAHLDQIRYRLGIDGDLAIRANDLCHIMLPGSHHATGIEISNLATVELDDADTVVDIAVLGELGLQGGDADRHDGLDLAVLAKVPQCQVDVVDVAVDEDAAAELGVGDEEAGWVEFVAGLGAEDRGTADVAAVAAGPGVAVGGVEAA